jgi:hypothetical protein
MDDEQYATNDERKTTIVPEKREEGPFPIQAMASIRIG